MKTINLNDLLKRVEARKLELGIIDTPESVEALRNKGGNRTPEKRELLRRAEGRALEAGRKPIKSYY